MDTPPPSPDRDAPAAANPGYAAGAIARALRALEHAPGAVRPGGRAAAWWSVLRGMLSGSLAIGSRTPIAKVPAWATPQVLAGGFASGRLMAGGPLREHELGWLTDHGRAELAEPARLAAAAAAAAEARIAQAEPAGRWPAIRDATATATAAERAAKPARAAIHAGLLGEQGFQALADRLADGGYRVEVPEEAALLCVAWLALHGHGDEAGSILDAIAPWFDQLRFYPVPAAQPRRAIGVCLHSLGEVRARWQRMRVPARIEHQRQVLATCVPLHDRLIALWLETVTGAAPSMQGGAIAGGWPCQHYPAGWASRARDLTGELAAAACGRLGQRWRDGRRGTFPWLAGPLAIAAADPAALGGREVARIRLALAQIAGARGLPGTPRCQALREAQQRALDKPALPRFAAMLSRRTTADPADEGLPAARLTELSAAIRAEEDAGLAGLALPSPLVRKLVQAREGSLADLITFGIAGSCESLVRAFPLLVARGRAAGWSDPALARLAGESYLAFARRRSLLLLDLQSQVRRLELPWLAAIERHRDRASEARDAARILLREVTLAALRGFPHTILPNRFLSAASTLVEDAGLGLPLTRELAADIFTGSFTGQFLAAAQLAGTLLDGSLYARYYAIPYARIAGMRAEGREDRAKTCPELARLCSERADVTTTGRGSPAANGSVIEQQQIITTHNLAALTLALGLDDDLRTEFPELARTCFTAALDRLERVPSGWVQRLRMVKHAAYAWRQMLFFLSRATAAEQAAFPGWALGQLASRAERMRSGMLPAVRGLAAAVAGEAPHASDPASPAGIRFLGWTTGRHWLLQRMRLAEA